MASSLRGEARLQGGATELFPVPLTLEGASVLHQMARFRWPTWRKLGSAERSRLVSEAAPVLARMESGQSALYSVLGHKGDLLLVHFRKSFDELKQIELELSRTALSDYLEIGKSYLSVVELGLYESSVKLYRTLQERGIEPHSEEWNREVSEAMERQREAMKPRLWPEIPAARYVCFYPMDRRRGEGKNWYTLPIEERQRQMDEHGKVGRRYAGTVRQIITGSIGFDDWEWGVDLFADDPLVFKKLIYEMRFDEVSAVYALFGEFIVGVRVPVAQLGELLEGKLPEKR
ncbi:MAG TPA: hydrogen peroxide-dependent heme synthase [Terriglobales bacterium]|jgi:hydrogen peroxide-dependent heme synthase|nr:hydrogen peroxide-dependent heme synthase [Terriglobales bacterium]